MRLSLCSISVCLLALAGGCTVVTNNNASDGGGSGTTGSSTASSTTGGTTGDDAGTAGASTGTTGSTATGGDAGTSGGDIDGGATGDSGDAGPSTTGDGGPATTGDGGPLTDGSASDGGDMLPPPDLTHACNAAGDGYETNNDFATAKPVALTANGLLRIGAGVADSDPDFYTFVAPKSDPVSVSVLYTVASGNASNLSLTVYDVGDNYVDQDTTIRTGPSQTLHTEFEAAAANSNYAVAVKSDTDTCTPYELDVNALVCTDAYEDNDDQPSAAAITLDATSKASLSATIDGLDDDYYQFVVPKHDPVKITGTYTRPASDAVDLSMTIYNQTSDYVDQDAAARTQSSETMQVLWEPDAAGETYYAAIKSNTEGTCAPYNLAIDALACTDSFEDNDDFASAKALSGSQTATVSSLDDDYYILSTPGATGTCTVSYTPTSGSGQQLTLTLYNTTQDYITQDATPRSGNSQTLTVSWTANDSPHFIKIEASDTDCTTYTIQCQ